MLVFRHRTRFSYICYALEHKLIRHPFSRLAKRPASQRGITMVEMAFGVLIVGAVLAVTLIYVRNVLAESRATDELKELPVVVARLQKLYVDAPSFAGINTAGVSRSGVYPEERINPAAGTIANRWNGSITIASANGDSDAMLTYTNLGRAECMSLMPQLVNVVDTITVAGTLVKPSGAPVDPALLSGSCTSGVTVVYTIPKG